MIGMKGFAQFWTNVLLLAYFLAIMTKGRDGIMAYALGHPGVAAILVFVTVTVWSLFVILDIGDWRERRAKARAEAEPAAEEKK